MLVSLTAQAETQWPYVNTIPVSSCTDAESYFERTSELSPIEGIWAITYTITQKSYLYNEPKINECETTFYIIRATSPNDCFGVYICDGDRLHYIMSIREGSHGLYQWGWAPKTCEASDLKNFRVKSDTFTVVFRNISQRLKRQIFDNIGRNVIVDITIEGEKI